MSLLIGYLGQWLIKNKESGFIFSASTGIQLPDSAIISPSTGWISTERIAQNPEADNDGEFLKVAPDFIVEIKSQSDSLKKLKKKMQMCRLFF